MRKIETKTLKQQREKKQKRNQLILSVFLVGILLFSVFGYSFISQGNENNNSKIINYKDKEFIEKNGFFILNSENLNFFIRNNPLKLKNISIEQNIKDISSYANKPLYTYSLNSSGISKSEILNNLGQIILRYQEACPEINSNISQENFKCNSELPRKDCENNIIILQVKENALKNIYQEKGCVYITGNTDEELVELTDKFLLNIFNLDI